jgi:hypothetical protein
MAAKRATVGDVLGKFLSDFRGSRARKFAALDKPLRVRRQRGEHVVDFYRRVRDEQSPHYAAMFRLLLERYGIEPGRGLAQRDLERLLSGVLRDYVPAFEVAADPDYLGPGHPRTGITDRQKAAIDRAVADGTSVREACLRLKKRDPKAGGALAKAYERATKK